MLAKEFRFHRQKDVKRVYRDGSSVRSKQASLKYLKNKKETNRVAVVVSKKVHKNAVVRNRIRRRGYEIIRRCWGDTAQGFDLVFVVYDHKLAKLDHAEVQAVFEGLLRKADLLPKP